MKAGSGARVLVLVGLLAARIVTAQVPHAPVEGRPAQPTLADVPVPDLERRLRALGPGEPGAYYLLAEELAAESEGNAEARKTARELFALSAELARTAPPRAAGLPPGLTRSACLALASIADRDADRRWLLALAGSLGTEGSSRRFAPPTPGQTREEAALDLATAIGLARAGEGRRAEQILAKETVVELLDLYEGMLAPYGHRDGTAILRKEISQWPVCPSCSNRRILVRGGEQSKSATVCPTCNGNPGPTLTDEELMRQLRLESALLSGIVRSWSAQVATDGGATLREPDISELAPTYGVDAKRPYWFAGQWYDSATPSGVTPVPATKPGP